MPLAVHDHSKRFVFFDPPECGQEYISRRVINGHEAKRHRYPWMVSVQIVTTIKKETETWMEVSECGGSLITDRHVLTAAHCLLVKGQDDAFAYATPRSLHIVLGAHTQADRQRLQSLRVDSVIVHEDYQPRRAGISKRSDDVAIIAVKDSLQFNDFLNPICLPDFSDCEKGSLFLTGWGNQNSEKEVVPAKALFEVEQPERSNSTCIRHYGSDKFEPDKQICAGDQRGNCRGDSGGPLSTRKDGFVYQVGVTSFSKKGCNVAEGTDAPGVYERLTYHLNWIKKHTTGGQYCAAPHHPFLKTDPGDPVSNIFEKLFGNRW